MKEYRHDREPTGAAPTDDQPMLAPRPRPAGFFRALVVAAVAAAASAAGCYDSGPDDDDDAGDIVTETRDVAVDTYAAPLYGVP